MKKGIIVKIAGISAFTFLALMTIFWFGITRHFGSETFQVGGDKSLVELVTPFIGTGGYLINNGAVYPGATSPFGMVQLSPDTSFGPYDWKNLLLRTNAFPSGYHWAHEHLRGFSFTHFSGAGLPEGGILRWFVSSEREYIKALGSTYKFQHTQESASAGYYQLHLGAKNLMIALTTTPHVGLAQLQRQREGEGEGKALYLHFNPRSTISPRDKVSHDSFVRKALVEENFVEGKITTLGSFSKTYGGEVYYFVLEYGKGLSLIDLNESGDAMGFSFLLDPLRDEFEFSVGFSATGIQQAYQNRQSELGKDNFKAVRMKNSKRWQRLLEKIRIETSNPTLKAKFYTALYHSMLMPNQYSDADGQFQSFTGDLKKESFTYMGNLSLWDTFRTVHPLYSLILPDVQGHIINSLLDMAHANEQLPRWPLGRGDSQVMLGFPSIIVISEAILKGVPGFDHAYAYKQMVKHTLAMERSRDALEKECFELAFCPASQGWSVSRSLELSWAYYALAQVAERMQEEANSKKFGSFAKIYQNLWHGQEGYFLPKDREGEWQTWQQDWAVSLLRGQYTEGSKEQWRWSFPQAVRFIKEHWESEAPIDYELNRYFEKAQKRGSGIMPSKNYWHGNQHTLAAAFLFNDLGKASLTQKWSRWILASQYKMAADGIPGNDDAGTLSAWFIFVSLGLYPQAGSVQYWLSTPSVEGAILDLGSNKNLQIRVHGDPKENIYIKRVEWNHKQLCNPTITHEEINEGGVLDYYLAKKAQRKGGFSCDW